MKIYYGHIIRNLNQIADSDSINDTIQPIFEQMRL